MALHCHAKTADILTQIYRSTYVNIRARRMNTNLTSACVKCDLFCGTSASLGATVAEYASGSDPQFIFIIRGHNVVGMNKEQSSHF